MKNKKNNGQEKIRKPQIELSNVPGKLEAPKTGSDSLKIASLFLMFLFFSFIKPVSCASPTNDTSSKSLEFCNEQVANHFNCYWFFYVYGILFALFSSIETFLMELTEEEVLNWEPANWRSEPITAFFVVCIKFVRSSTLQFKFTKILCTYFFTAWTTVTLDDTLEQACQAKVCQACRLT